MSYTHISCTCTQQRVPRGGAACGALTWTGGCESRAAAVMLHPHPPKGQGCTRKLPAVFSLQCIGNQDAFPGRAAIATTLLQLPMGGFGAEGTATLLQLHAGLTLCAPTSAHTNPTMHVAILYFINTSRASLLPPLPLPADSNAPTWANSLDGQVRALTLTLLPSCRLAHNRSCSSHPSTAPCYFCKLGRITPLARDLPAVPCMHSTAS